MTIASLEKKLFTRDDAGFKKDLFDILDAMEKGRPVLGGERIAPEGKPHYSPGIYPLHKDASFFDNQNATQRLATCITGFLCAPKLELETLEVRKLIFYKTHLTDIFYLSDFGNLDHIMDYRELWSPNGGFQLKSDADVLMLMICWTINSQMEMPFATLIEKIPQEIFQTLTSVFYQLEQIQTLTGYEQFDKALYAFLELPNGLDVSLCSVMLVNIWMGCSYWDLPSRHRIKQKINRLFRHAYPDIPEVKTHSVGRKPRVAVLLEKYRSDHAMYRCYHAHLLNLKTEFHTCLFADQRDLDGVSCRDGEQTITFDAAKESLQSIARKVSEFKPDVVLYPSLGMSVWTVILSNFRLAPLQVMSYGHPASAFSEVIDYGLLVGLEPGPGYQALCQEKVISFNLDYGQDIELHPKTDFTLSSPAVPAGDEPVRIAINSSLMKISDRVLQACKLILKNSSRPVEFDFFPSHERAFKLLALEKKITMTLGHGHRIHGPQEYRIYQHLLASCHFAIGTFPFGGTNTNIDSILLGQPKLYLQGGDELAEKTDYSTFLRFDDNGGFAYKSELELVAAAIIWIHNPQEHAAAVANVQRMRERLLQRLSTSSTSPEPTEHYFTRGIRKIVDERGHNRTEH
ncbi:hypothetical protein [Marinobacter sp. NFXS9]|uniref:hypothetical protein n=1 Tax=Marinobacter sp. NFXS9 TaxID=2818433 RepID=UPI0032DF569F